MSNYTAALLMAQMRGLPQPVREQEPKVDATTLEVQRRLRGNADYSAIHESNAKGQREYEAAVRKRTQELRSQGVPYAEHVARRQLRDEAQQRSEAEQRRQVHEQMRQQAATSEREKWERRASAPLVPKGAIPPGTSVNDHSYITTRDRASEKLMAQANGTVWALYEEEQAETA
ncbi:hypothetical protein [Streptomyces sp. DSM 41634]|uniref:hypothetical protein n=1 Tax=Streptomyces sp. DSM 41634 TaxID=3448656 RepID=UPI00403FDD06